MEKILFRSTNRQAHPVDFKTCLLTGQAPDYGLYLPVTVPRFTVKELDSFREKSYPEIACAVVKPFLQDEIPDAQLSRMAHQAYNFDVLLQLVRPNLYLLWLDRGPTASFKDFAARFMARLMHHFAREKHQNLTVLVATSGDTGGAVADAFYDLEGISVVVLFPEKEVTGRQRKQMTTLGKNVTALAVQGKFDDCQALVKQAFQDPALRHLNLTSANSINFGRLLPQAIYYFYAYSRLGQKEIVFSVPSGNFGNLLGGVLAREMGLPVRKFIVAVNENDEFPNFLKTGRYVPVVPSRQCSSNAMNVGHPSNLARLIDWYGGWLLDERDEKGAVIRKGMLKEEPDMERLQKDFLSFSISEQEVDETISEVFHKYEIILEPHGAVAFKAVEKAGLPGLTVSLETANPAKFPEKIQALLDVELQVPESLSRLDAKSEQYETIANSYEEFAARLARL